jgi:hypothetical protein
MDDHGQVRISNILAQLALHPSLLSDLLHLAKMSKHVLLILAGFLDCFIEQLDRQPAK